MEKLKEPVNALEKLYLRVFAKNIGTPNLEKELRFEAAKICVPYTMENKIFTYAYYNNEQEYISIGNCLKTGNRYFNYCELKRGKGKSITLDKNNQIVSQKRWSSIKISKPYNLYSELQVFHRFHVELFTYYKELTLEEYAKGISETLFTHSFYKLFVFSYDQPTRTVIWSNRKWKTINEEVNIIGSDLKFGPEIISLLSKIKKSHRLWKRFFKD